MSKLDKNEAVVETVAKIIHIGRNEEYRTIDPCYHKVKYIDTDGETQEKIMAAHIIWKLLKLFNYENDSEDPDFLEDHFCKYEGFVPYVPPPPRPPREDGIKNVDRIFNGCDSSVTPCRHYYTVFMHNGDTIKKRSDSKTIAELIDDIGMPHNNGTNREYVQEHFFKPNGMTYDKNKKRY